MGFSFMRLITNAVPNFASDNPERDAEVSPKAKDSLYAYQLACPNVFALNERSFYAAGSVDHEKTSQRVYNALVKSGVLLDSGVIDTNKIGPKFVHTLAFVSVAAQRNVVGVLFWWIEEQQRLKKLHLDDEELTGLIADAEKSAEGGNAETLDQMKIDRERVRMRIQQAPSQRSREAEEGRTAPGQIHDEHPPQYSAR